MIPPLILKHVQSNLERESSSLPEVNLGFTLFQAALQFKEGSLRTTWYLKFKFNFVGFTKRTTSKTRLFSSIILLNQIQIKQANESNTYLHVQQPADWGITYQTKK